MSNVRIDNLLKIYPETKGPGVTAVKGIDLEVHEGEFMVLVGPSGCGKSTTLRMIAGLEEITGGTITIGDRVVNDVLPKDRDIAMVFQNYALYPQMTVYDNMAFGLKLRKTPKDEIDRRVREAATLLELEAYLNRRPKALSGGQRQRVAVGRAIVRNPSVFLFDEPLSNLDAKMRVSMRAEIVRLHARLKTTMIYVTHDQVEAMTMGDRICVMKDGKVMQVDEPINLYQKPKNLFVAGFIGSPPMNLINGTLRKEGSELRFTETAGNSPLQFTLPSAIIAQPEIEPDRRVVLGIRPEDLVIAEDGAGADLRLERSELMGAETFLHLASDKHSLIARVRPGKYPGINQSLPIRFDLSKAHLFDAETGHNLR